MFSNKGQTHTHFTQTYIHSLYTALWDVRKILFASINPSCGYQNILGYFPPKLACLQGNCTVFSGSEPKWVPFRGIFRNFHQRMERIFISYFMVFFYFFIYFFIAEWTEFRKTRTHIHTSTFFTDTDDQVKRIPPPSNFLHLFPTDRICLKAPGCNLSKERNKCCCTHYIENVQYEYMYNVF